MESEKGHMLVTDNWAICLRELNWPLNITDAPWLGPRLSWSDSDNKSHLPHLPLIGYSDEPNEEG